MGTHSERSTREVYIDSMKKLNEIGREFKKNK